jgi:hypothetical protein
MTSLISLIFVDFRLMKNIIFNKTERFVGRNTSNHACQNFIFYSKSNCETILIFPPRDNRGQNNKQSLHGNQSLLTLLSAVCLAEKQKIPIL